MFKRKTPFDSKAAHTLQNYSPTIGGTGDSESIPLWMATMANMASSNSTSKPSLHHWTGSPLDPGLSTWKRNFQAFATLKHWTIADALRNLPFFVEGECVNLFLEARDNVFSKWQEEYDRGNRYRITFNHYWAELDNIIHGPDHERTSLKQFNDMNARPGESFGQFYARVLEMRRIIEQFPAERTKARTIRDRNMLNVLRDGAPTRLAEALVTSPVTSLEEMIEIGRKWDRAQVAKFNMATGNAFMMDDPDLIKKQVTETTTRTKLQKRPPAKTVDETPENSDDGSDEDTKADESDEEAEYVPLEETVKAKDVKKTRYPLRKRTKRYSASSMTSPDLAQAFGQIAANFNMINSGLASLHNRLPLALPASTLPTNLSMTPPVQHFQSTPTPPQITHVPVPVKKEDYFPPTPPPTGRGGANPFQFPGGSAADLAQYRIQHRLQNTCANCNEKGHYSRHCKASCSRCNSPGHSKFHCPLPYNTK